MFLVKIRRKFWFPRKIKCEKFWFEFEVKDGNSKMLYQIPMRLVCETESGENHIIGNISERDFSVEVLKRGLPI